MIGKGSELTRDALISLKTKREPFGSLFVWVKS